MHVPDFTKRPNAERVLREWYAIRKSLDEEEMENTFLSFREDIRKAVNPEFPVGESTPSGRLKSTKSRSTRSDKRDISSILNKVSVIFPSVIVQFTYASCVISAESRSCAQFFFLLAQVSLVILF